MKTLRNLALVIVFFLVSAITTFAQSDIIIRHNGDTIKGKLIRINEYTVVYSYDNESAENTLSRYAIEKIIHGQSGRVENITEKIVVTSEADWEKVIVLEEKSYIAGLKKVEEIRGQTAYINMQTGNTGDKKALQKLKRAAATLQCPFVLITSEKTTVGAESNTLGGSQSIKTGVAYKY
jgi:hypothetical protein